MPNFFHDLCGSEHLETPFWLQPRAGEAGGAGGAGGAGEGRRGEHDAPHDETAAEVLLRIASDVMPGMFSGATFRPLFVPHDAPLDGKISFARGGNTFVFDIEALLTPNAAPEHHRR